MRYAQWDMTGWHRDYAPCVWRRQATDEQKRVGREIWVRRGKITATLLCEAHKRQLQAATGDIEEGPSLSLRGTSLPPQVPLRGSHKFPKNREWAITRSPWAYVHCEDTLRQKGT
ncbi:MAG: hypothetical protein AVDCRST_MAG25-3442 [uncultured Rubrobacteraceae bacterium]|uniref:Uncharacterized protein n=1 Tax=uncultured Rubrobacteraceae bacterium TaxID=349277 RepID=A0A6J4S9Q4_9ACTN|nr:MAG: hypothetical protein AVDCRST_MAG25-3442 [uncultured Rubrobacteraceae bacterium]